MSLYKRKDSDIWWVNIRHAGRRVRRSTGTADRAAAQKLHNQIQVELWALVPIVDERIWSDAVDLWTQAKPRSDQEIYSLLKFSKSFPDRGLSAVTRESVHEALSFCVAASTYKRYRAIVSSILHLAHKQGWLKTLPLLATRTEKAKSPDWLTREQWLKLYVELPAHLKPMAEFAVETGLRQANVLGLRWTEVSLERRLVWINAEDAKANKALPVPLNDRALAVLAAQEGLHGAIVFPYQGKAIGDVKTAFLKACVRAKLGTVTKIDGHTRYEGFTWHGFRHTWATWHVQNGTPLDVLQKLGGWSDTRMVLRYGHHSPGYLASFADNNRKTA